MSKKKRLTDPNEIEATLILANGGDDDESAEESSHKKLTETETFAASNGQFRFLCEFASGGVGKVGKARDLVFDRIVAVKKLNDQFRDNPRMVSNFINECRLNANLDHPSIVPVYAMCKDESGHVEVMMKLIHGTSFAKFVKEARQIYDKKKIFNYEESVALKSRLEYFLKICEAVSYCHNRGVMHGDIKPDNIMMGEFGEVYLMDWGCAQPLNVVLKQLTGTPNYLPPEFLRDRRTSTLVDVFSLGMVLFEVVTLQHGKNSNAAPAAEGANDAKDTANTESLDVYNHSSYRHYQPKLRIGKRIKAIICKAIDPDPAKRYQSVHDLASDIRHYIYDEEITALPDSTTRKLFRLISRNRIKTLLIIGGVIAFLAGWIFYSYYQHSEQEQLTGRIITQQLRLQSITDRQATTVEKHFLLAQAQLLLFADNLIEEMSRPHQANYKFYDNDHYKSPETSPPGMVKSEYYPNPVNLKYMVRIPPDHPVQLPFQLPSDQQFTQICNKIIRYTLDSHKISLLDRQFHEKLFEENNLIQRLFVAWGDGTRYSYPGTYQKSLFHDYLHSVWWEQLEHSVNSQEISWSKPYMNNSGQILINCIYPLFSTRKEFLGFAGIELRVAKLFDSVLKAHQADSVHEYYYIGRHNHVLSFDNNGITMTNQEGKLPNGTPAQTLIFLKDRLRNNNFRQIETEFNGTKYHVDGNIIPTPGGTLLQLVKDKDFLNHRHKADEI